MFEMRIEGQVVCLRCALGLLPPPCLRMGLVVVSGLGHLTSKVRDRCPMVADVLPQLEEANLRMNLHSGRWLAELRTRRRLVINQCGRQELPRVESVCLFHRKRLATSEANTEGQTPCYQHRRSYGWHLLCAGTWSTQVQRRRAYYPS